MKKTATFPKVDCHVAKHSYLYPRNNHLNVGPNHVQVEVNHLYGGTNGVEDELNRIQTVPNGVYAHCNDFPCKPNRLHADNDCRTPADN